MAWRYSLVFSLLGRNTFVASVFQKYVKAEFFGLV